MKHYEGMFLTHNQEARKDTDYLAEHVKGLIEKSGGTVHQLKKWDERKLAYSIKRVTHGVYFLTYFTGDQETVAKLRGEVRLSSLVLRHLVLKLDAAMEKPLETFAEAQQRLAGIERKVEGGGDELVAATRVPDEFNAVVGVDEPRE